MYSFPFSHRSSRSPLVLFFFFSFFLFFSNLSFSPHFLTRTHNSLFHALLFTALFSFLFSFSFLFPPFTLQRVQHVQSPIYIMYTHLVSRFLFFPMIMFLALFLTHSLSPFARNKSSQTGAFSFPFLSFFFFLFFSIWPAGYAGYVVNARKKNIYIYIFTYKRKKEG